MRRHAVRLTGLLALLLPATPVAAEDPGAPFDNVGLARFGSKFITQPTNALAIDYLTTKLCAFGYEPELQWFEPRPGIRSANVIARLPGTERPDVVYVVGSHFDSVERGPGRTTSRPAPPPSSRPPASWRRAPSDELGSGRSRFASPGGTGSKLGLSNSSQSNSKQNR